MSFSEPKVTIDLKEYESLLKSKKELKDQEGKQPLSDEQIYGAIMFMFSTKNKTMQAGELDRKLAEIGVKIINVSGEKYTFKLRPL